MKLLLNLRVSEVWLVELLSCNAMESVFRVQNLGGTVYASHLPNILGIDLILNILSVAMGK